ncbi:RrF2 family transcriptional regulator [Pinibacter soli]|uniref:Rrf2 family transcriptional regulator n=1 Tax=Pinibacter soli TaxID=3044211 RepID=A0ABT6RGY0_9BACT|nr:Rrf2 family transcriptional regulator [Pinibacter soli]MDI3321828.1 Rrf2 family transcriptional regulator [Pinibacter soli]
MLFSKTCEYGIRAAVYIASQSDKAERTGIEEICENIEAPRHFTAKILQVLTRNHLLSSQKGVNGGFYMTAEQLKQPIITLVEAIEGKEVLSKCGLGLKACSETEPCPLHNKYASIRNDIKKMLSGMTIKDMAVSLQTGGTFLKVD